MIDIYKANSYDEAIEFNGEIKNPYKKFLNFFNDHNYKDLYKKKKFDHNFLKKTGITFNLNSFDENDKYFKNLSDGWAYSLKVAITKLPSFDFKKFEKK